MMGIERTNVDAAVDPAVEGLLRFAGSREDTLDPEDYTLLHDAALLVWMRQVKARRNRRLVGGVALLAAVVLLVVGLRARTLNVEPAGTRLVSVETIAGNLELERAGVWERLEPGSTVAAGSWLRTDRGAAQLQAFGVAFRIDGGGRLAFFEGRRVELERGRLYVDTGAGGGASGPRLSIETSFGRVVDIGTQFEVTSGEEDGELGVRVRDGSVRLITDESQEALVATAGQQLRRKPSGAFELSSTPVYGETWAWILKAGRPFDLEGATLGDYLHWLEGETGWIVRFADASTEPEARSVVLSGPSTGDQPANQTVDSVLASSGFEFEVAEGVLTIR